MCSGAGPTVDMSGLIAGWQPLGLVDGPGCRFVLFFQGCNMFCPTCHNPHTRQLCVGCGNCVAVCPGGALKLEGGQLRFDAETCEACERCVDVCVHSANPRARRMTVADVVEMVRPYKPYLAGVTLSGGEVTCQPRFARKLLLALEGELALAGLLDSNGLATREVWDQLLPAAEGVLLDIKAVEPELHRQLTGTELAPVLASLKYIHGQGKLVEVRHLLIPGFTAGEEHFRKLCALVREMTPQPPLRLLAYSNLRADKEIPALSQEELASWQERAREAGIERVI